MPPSNLDHPKHFWTARMGCWAPRVPALSVFKSFSNSRKAKDRPQLFPYFLSVNELGTSDFQIWSAYKDQKHDLFLPSNAQSSAAGVAGLIESSSSRLTYALTAPPPHPNMVKPPASVPSDINGRPGHS